MSSPAEVQEVEEKQDISKGEEKNEYQLSPEDTEHIRRKTKMIEEEENEDDNDNNDQGEGKADDQTLWELDPNWGKEGRKFIQPIFKMARKYAKARDTCLDHICHPWLTAPLLGPLSYRWWAIDINFLELCFFAAVFRGATAGGSGSDFGIATGIITMLVVGTIPRNNILRFLVGVPFERMVKYHRWCSYYLAVPLFLHALLEAEFFSDYTRITSTVGWITFMVIVCTSVVIFRRHYFEFFYFIHLLFTVYLAASIAHEIMNLGFILPGLVMYVLDLFLRVMRYWTTSSKTISITHLEEDMSSLRLDKKFNFQAGQYAFVLIPSISRLQWHPYSISSAPQESTITFHVADNGSWSHSVTRLPDDKPITVKIDGPYGKVGVRYRKCDTLAIFCAGAGATPMMSILKDVYFRKKLKQEKQCKVKKVYLFWTVGRLGCVDWFVEDIRQLQAHPLDELDIEFNIHVTRTSQRSGTLLEEGDPFGIPIKRGRPDLKAEFERMKEAVPSGTNVAVLACGPKAYAYQVRKRCFMHTTKHTKFIYHSETFEY